MSNHPNRNWRREWRVQPLHPSFAGIDWKSAIKNYRTQRGLTQLELSKRLGVDLRTVVYWESGKISPPDYLLLALSVLE